MRNLLNLKLSFIVLLMISVTSCVQDNKLELLNIHTGEVFKLGNSKVIFGKTSGKNITSVDYYINNQFVEKLNVVQNKFSLTLNFDNVGNYVFKIIAKDSQENELAQLSTNYEVIKEVVAEPKPPTTGNGWTNFNYTAPANSELNTRKRLWATYYFLPLVKQLTIGGYALRDMSGKSLGMRVGLKDWCDAAMEGSVIIKMLTGEIRTLNYAGTSSGNAVNCKRYYSINTSRTKFRAAKGEYGDGVKGYNLVPFRSIAVDKRYIPYGTLLFIPDAVGTVITLPNGEQKIHDGYFFSADTGGAIKNTHIDVYIGTSKKNPFRFVKSSSSKTFAAYIVNNSKIKMELKNFHLNLKSN